MVDISVIITGHHEGLLAGVTLRSARNAIRHVGSSGAETELIVVLDRADDITRGTILGADEWVDCLIETDHGDPGLARNTGIQKARGRFSCFLDADDLWSTNWLSEAWRAAVARPEAIWHSHCNLVFGHQRNLWWHIDSESALFDADFLRWSNYWDALSFAATSLYRDYPFRENDLKAGFGHEDWFWNVQTLRAGFSHKPVEGTIHFKRRRPNSQMAIVAKNDATIWPN